MIYDIESIREKPSKCADFGGFFVEKRKFATFFG